MGKALLLAAVALFAAACGGAGTKTTRANAATDGKPGLGRIDQGERCDAKIGREALVDLNQDEVPDVRKVYKTIEDKDEVLVCREADMNFDGVKDIFVFYTDSGQLTRDEVDLDYDRKIDIISTYAKGKVIKQEIDTNSDGLVDRVRHLKDDLPIRVEGDTDGDGRVDLWEYYQDGNLVRIGTDDDGDGRADTWSRDNATEEGVADKPAEGEEVKKEKSEGEAFETNDPEKEEEAAPPASDDKTEIGKKSGKAKKSEKSPPEKAKAPSAPAKDKTDDPGKTPADPKGAKKEKSE